MCLQFGFVIFWQKAFGAKAAHKMLVKLPPGEVEGESVAGDERVQEETQVRVRRRVLLDVAVAKFVAADK
jgi:hypothetical protein